MPATIPFVLLLPTLAFAAVTPAALPTTTTLGVLAPSRGDAIATDKAQAGPETQPATESNAGANASAEPTPAESSGALADVSDEGSILDDPTELSAQGAGAYISISPTVEAGSGTFVLEPGSRNEYFAWSADILPSYQFRDKTKISLLVALTQELTQSDSDTSAHRLLLNDIRLSVQRPIYLFEQSGTQLSGELNVFAPTSLASQFDTLRAGVDARFHVKQPLGDFFFTFRTAFRKNFHQYASPVLTDETGSGGEPLILPRGQSSDGFSLPREAGNERVNEGLIVGGDNNIEFSWSNRLLAMYQFTEKLSFTATYTLAHGFTYAGHERDELTGVNAIPGRGRRDASAALLSLDYELNRMWSFGTGINTLSTPRTGDGKAIRFPFYEFAGAEQNLSTFFISATFTEGIPL